MSADDMRRRKPLMLTRFPFDSPEMMRRCQFFFNVFGLELPEYLSCDQFADSKNPDICVGQKQMREAYQRQLKPSKCRHSTASHLRVRWRREGKTLRFSAIITSERGKLWIEIGRNGQISKRQYVHDEKSCLPIESR